MTTTLIEELHAAEFDSFMAYLNDHLSDNGNDSTGYFQPLSRAQSVFPPERAAGFRIGLKTPVGSLSWRRAWVARNSIGQIVGHVDLRAYPEPYSSHRCLLGMGVDRGHRKQGIGLMLLKAAQRWAIEVAKLEWIDLQVLSSNQAAIYLYTQAGFTKVGEVPDMFKIDGRVFSYTTMTRDLAGSSAAGVAKHGASS
jgi:ribosomal protein S18 acetylase RimI-like enzyme